MGSLTYWIGLLVSALLFVYNNNIPTKGGPWRIERKQILHYLVDVERLFLKDSALVHQIQAEEEESIVVNKRSLQEINNNNNKIVW